MPFFGLLPFFELCVNAVRGILVFVQESSPILSILVLGFPIVGFCFGLLKRLFSM